MVQILFVVALVVVWVWGMVLVNQGRRAPIMYQPPTPAGEAAPPAIEVAPADTRSLWAGLIMVTLSSALIAVILLPLGFQKGVKNVCKKLDKWVENLGGEDTAEEISVPDVAKVVLPPDKKSLQYKGKMPPNCELGVVEMGGTDAKWSPAKLPDGAAAGTEVEVFFRRKTDGIFSEAVKFTVP